MKKKCSLSFLRNLLSNWVFQDVQAFSGTGRKRLHEKQVVVSTTGIKFSFSGGMGASRSPLRKVFFRIVFIQIFLKISFFVPVTGSCEVFTKTYYI